MFCAEFIEDKMPRISVLMGVYNCETTIEESIDSILCQTYTDWELIICDDGSTDNTVEIINEYCERFPEKIRLIKHDSNLGLNQTLNDCLDLAEGEIIARMDGDDISLPTRFEKEIIEFDKEPELSVVSCPMIYFDESGDWKTGVVHNKYPSPNNLVHGTIHAHAPCMIKTSVMREVGGYTVDKRLLRVEDWHLWVKVYSHGYYGKNISEPLYKMRDDHAATKRRKFKYRLNEAYVIILTVKTFHLSKINYFFAFRPIIVGLLPTFIYEFLHKHS